MLLIGLGEQDKLTVDALRRASALIVKNATKVTSVVTTLLDAAPASMDRADAAQAIVEGAALGSYQFLKYKGEKTATSLRRFSLLGQGGAAVSAAVDRGAAVAAATEWARDRVNEPAMELSPADFVSEARRLLRGSGVSVSVLDERQLSAKGLGGIVGVGQGSSRPPRLLTMTYSPPGARATIALVGKGVVFDSGGLSLKPASGMETMKTDMGGAAAVIGAMSAIAALKLSTKVVAYTPLVENMPSGTAIRPGDVLTIHNGKTVEVLNTDAEGRLILADALSLAATTKPDAIVDLATLTGACMVALGEKIAGLMGNNDALVAQVRAAADRSGEPVWPLPLPSDYRKLLDSEIADLRNISTGSYGGSITAGLFLKEFVGDIPWAHLDIAGPARASADDGYLVRGGTGFGLRTIVEVVAKFEKPTSVETVRGSGTSVRKAVARKATKKRSG